MQKTKSWLPLNKQTDLIQIICKLIERHSIDSHINKLLNVVRILCKFKCNNFSKKCRKRKGTKNRARYIGYLCCLVLWHVVFEVKILNYINVMKHKDHCEIGESKSDDLNRSIIMINYNAEN
jgi:hypothetical protein